MTLHPSLPLLLALASFCLAEPAPQSPLRPFSADAHTLLLYHFDEGEGTVAHDAGPHGYDGEISGAEWAAGKFGKALRFDGKDDCVFRQMTEAIRGLKQFTVECWFSQDDPSGRQFLVGQDVGFHFDLSNGQAMSLSIYNQGGGVKNADGLPHQHLGVGLGSVRAGKWHHNAATYAGRYLSFFHDGVLKARLEAAKDFLLGVASRGFWVGCYVGTDFWFSGRIDEVRVSDCVRYDPDRALSPGGEVFDMPIKPKPVKQVRAPKTTGAAHLEVTLKKLYGGNASGWVSLKPPGRKAAIVGQYALTDMQDGAETKLSLDVSDESDMSDQSDGPYVLALEPEDTGAYLAATAAKLVVGEKVVAQWTGEVRSRRTFQPPVLVPLQVGAAAEHSKPARIVLLPTEVDRRWGDLELDSEDPDSPPVLAGDGYAEWWLSQAAETTYRVYLRYAAAGLRPCDLVIDGDDLNAYDMCAVNRSLGRRPADALWEYQGTVTLKPGVHWLRLQDVLPDVVALRLEPIAASKPVAVPWDRYAVPEAGFLCAAKAWDAQPLVGVPTGAKAATDTGAAEPALRFSASFTNTDTANLFAGDCVRFEHRGRFDLEPFGRLSFRFEGQGTGHVVSLWLVDVKGDEKLLWRTRDSEPGPQDVAVPVSFEGNSVFNPAHVVAVCVELDEGNQHAAQANQFAVALTNPRLERRDDLALPEGYAQLLARAKQALKALLPKLPKKVAPLRSSGFRPWTEPMVPEDHPLFATTDPKPVTRKTLGYDLHLTGARGDAANTLDDFHKSYDFGDICWPHIGILPLRANYKTDEDYQRALKELEERLKDVRDRGLFLWDLWGYVPDNAQFPWKVAPEHDEILKRVCGDRFLGYDNGEQDGRYIGSYADRDPITNRKEGWTCFAKWDQGICNDSMDYMNATGSLNYSHYYGERGARTLGLETAQGLPSDTLMFAFLRGASKQYGRLTTQATSVWNRFGYNLYNDRKTNGANGYGFGPHKGCSLSLHKRLFLSSYTGGDSIVGSETGQFTGDRLESGAPELSPLGKQHLQIREWVKQHPDRGVLYTPVAFMLDFYNGWNMPRHLYRSDKYKVWGKLPYEKGDYLTDALFRLVWPGYEDCSYLRNERGFVCPTPFGDLFDVVTNRCHPEILAQYRTIMLLGDVELTPEVAANLGRFVEAGGDLVLDARHARALPANVSGMTLGAEATGCLSRYLPTGETFDEQPYTYTVATLSGASPLLVNEQGHPLLAVNRVGKGRVIVGTADYWMTDRLTYRTPEIVNMEPPYRLLRGVQAALGQYFDSLNPVEVSPPGLNVRTCCYDNDPKRLLLGLTNNDLFADWRGTFSVRLGTVASATELRSSTKLRPSKAIDLRIPAGDVAIVEARLR